MDIFWAIVGALLTAYNWVTDAIVILGNSRGLTNILLIVLIWQVDKLHQSYGE
jgi:hypothetical protein